MDNSLDRLVKDSTPRMVLRRFMEVTEPKDTPALLRNRAASANERPAKEISSSKKSRPVKSKRGGEKLHSDVLRHQSGQSSFFMDQTLSTSVIQGINQTYANIVAPESGSSSVDSSIDLEKGAKFHKQKKKKLLTARLPAEMVTKPPLKKKKKSIPLSNSTKETLSRQDFVPSIMVQETQDKHEGSSVLADTAGDETLSVVRGINQTYANIVAPESDSSVNSSIDLEKGARFRKQQKRKLVTEPLPAEIVSQPPLKKKKKKVVPLSDSTQEAVSRQANTMVQGTLEAGTAGEKIYSLPIKSMSKKAERGLRGSSASPNTSPISVTSTRSDATYNFSSDYDDTLSDIMEAKRRFANKIASRKLNLPSLIEALQTKQKSADPVTVADILDTLNDPEVQVTSADKPSQESQKDTDKESVDDDPEELSMDSDPIPPPLSFRDNEASKSITLREANFTDVDASTYVSLVEEYDDAMGEDQLPKTPALLDEDLVMDLQRKSLEQVDANTSKTSTRSSPRKSVSQATVATSPTRSSPRGRVSHATVAISPTRSSPRRSTSQISASKSTPSERVGQVTDASPMKTPTKMTPRSVGQVSTTQSLPRSVAQVSATKLSPRMSMDHLTSKSSRQSVGQVSATKSSPRRSVGQVTPRQSVGQVSATKSSPRRSVGQSTPRQSVGQVSATKSSPRRSVGQSTPRQSGDQVSATKSSPRRSVGQVTPYKSPRRSIGQVSATKVTPRRSMSQVSDATISKTPFGSLVTSVEQVTDSATTKTLIESSLKTSIGQNTNATITRTPTGSQAKSMSQVTDVTTTKISTRSPRSVSEVTGVTAKTPTTSSARKSVGQITDITTTETPTTSSRSVGQVIDVTTKTSRSSRKSVGQVTNVITKTPTRSSPRRSLGSATSMTPYRSSRQSLGRDISSALMSPQRTDKVDSTVTGGSLGRSRNAQVREGDPTTIISVASPTKARDESPIKSTSKSLHEDDAEDASFSDISKEFSLIPVTVRPSSVYMGDEEEASTSGETTHNIEVLHSLQETPKYQSSAPRSTARVRQMTMREFMEQLKTKPVQPPLTKPKPLLPSLLAAVAPSSSTRQEEPRSRPKGKRRKNRKKQLAASLPQRFTKEIFTHFAKCRVPKSAMAEVMKITEIFWRNLVKDVCSFQVTKKNPTKSIQHQDVEKLMRRQGLITSKESLDALVEQLLPMEMWGYFKTFPEPARNPFPLFTGPFFKTD